MPRRKRHKLSEYQDRFPDCYSDVTQIVSENEFFDNDVPATVGPGQANIETSRIAAANETISPNRAFHHEIPAEFGRYRIVRQLGVGAMGTVYLALDTQLDRHVALKIPNFRGSSDKELLERFLREARAAAKIQHRNICPVFDVGQIGGQHFITMAFIKGRPLSELINPEKLPPEKTSAILIHRLALALAQAHRYHVVHRDLKPANVMIDMSREPVVMDFGLAVQTDVEIRMTQEGAMLGTPAYMSPEQLNGKSDDVDQQSDIFSLGIILYELLTGKLPFDGTLPQVVCQILQEEPVPPTTLRPSLSSGIEAICKKMMAKEKSERFESMSDVAMAIKKHLSGTGTAAASMTGTTTVPEVTPTLVSTPSVTKERKVPALPSKTSDQEPAIAGMNWSQAVRYGKWLTVVVTTILGLWLLLSKLAIFQPSRNIEIQNLDPKVSDREDQNQLAEVEKSDEPTDEPQPWETMFNGQSLRGWQVLGDDGWSVEDSVIIGRAGTGKNRKSGLLLSDVDYEDFEMELEYWLASQANSGVFFRASPTGDPQGTNFYEVQLLEDTSKKYSKIADDQRTGAIFKQIKPEPIVKPKPRQWHSVRIRVLGNHAQVWINNTKVVDGQLGTAIESGSRIGLQHHSGLVKFRNLIVRPIK